MFAGTRFRLEKATLAIEIIAGRPELVTIPAGAYVEVISGPVGSDSDPMVTLSWEDRIVSMFAIAVTGERGEVRTKAAGSE